MEAPPKVMKEDIEAVLKERPTLVEEVRAAPEDPQNISRLISDVLEQAEGKAQVRERAIGERALESDKWCYRGVIIALGTVMVVVGFGAIAIAISGHDVPAVLVALGSGAVGALAALIAPQGGK